MVRNSKRNTDLHDRRPSTLIRNQYIKEIRLLQKKDKIMEASSGTQDSKLTWTISYFSNV